MKPLVATLFVTFLSCASVCAQDGWFRIHPEAVWMYSAPTADTLFAVAADELQRSTDAGKTWNRVADWPVTTEEDISGVKYTTSISFVHFGSTSHGVRTHTSKSELNWLGEYSIIERDEFTTDGGATWFFPASPYSAAGGYAFFFEPNTWMVARPASRVGPEYPGRSAGFAISTDAGSTWVNREQLSNFSKVLGVRSDLIFAMSNFSVDSGVTWIPGEREPRLAITPSRLYAWSYDSSHISTDDGRTWQSTLDDRMPEISNSKGVVYARDWRTDAYYRSLDSGLTYEPLPYFIPKERITLFDSTLMYAHQNGVLLRSITGGQKLKVESKTQASGFLVYPNPAVDEVNSKTELLWFDLLGRSFVVPSEMIGEEYRYDLGGLNAGAYIVRHGEKSHVVIIQH